MNGLYCLGLLSLLSIFVIAGHLIYLWLVSWSVHQQKQHQEQPTTAIGTEGVSPPGLALFGWVRFHGMGWTPGAALRVCSRRAPPHPLSQAGARVTVPRLRSGKFDCSWHSAMPLVLHFALSRFHSTRFVFVASCGRCLSFGALGLLLARWCLSFFVLEVLPPLFCFSSCWRLRLIFVL
jgi:hypothetical protein